MDEETESEQEEMEKPKREPKPEPVAVKVLGVKGESALVEWGGGLKRGYVPESAVKDGQVPAKVLERAVPYGVAWETVRMSATADQLAEELRRRGIWTAEDLFKNPRVALGALQATYRVDLAALNKLAAKGG